MVEAVFILITVAIKDCRSKIPILCLFKKQSVTAGFATMWRRTYQDVGHDIGGQRQKSNDIAKIAIGWGVNGPARRVL